jgi:kynurenine--oxoglutarate transaminase/cysteine-S-conjugate beta-lyase/glutamine--phenylpyruvate transaminase
MKMTLIIVLLPSLRSAGATFRTAAPAVTTAAPRRRSLFTKRFLSPTQSSPSSPFSLSPRLDGLDKPTVWHEFSPLAVEHNAVNLGQGFPDWNPPPFVIEAMERAVDPKYNRHANQYARSYAHMPLAKVLCEDYSERWGVPLDPATNIGTAVGCTNALFCALQGLLTPSDEVLLLEPAFDIYYAQVRMAGGVPVYCPLRPVGASNYDDGSPHSASDVFQLDLHELESMITPRTKVLLLNTPHNPTGKMFSRVELQGIADIVQRHPQLNVISDEVYEHIVFEPETEPHISIATLPGMFDRTLTLSSSGKTFSCTGWKVGWGVGPPHLVKALTAVQQWVNFSTPTPNQDAIAMAMQQARESYEGFDSFYEYLAADYKRKRGLLVDALQSAGMTPLLPPGGFFIMADTSHLNVPQEYLDEKTDAMPATPMPRDWALSRWMTKTVGVTAIPPSAFYSPDTLHLAQNLLRFAFCKGDETIFEANRRLAKYFGSDEKQL